MIELNWSLAGRMVGASFVFGVSVTSLVALLMSKSRRALAFAEKAKKSLSEVQVMMGEIRATREELNKKPLKPRNWTLEGVRVEELFALYTKWEKNDDRAARYQFWKTIKEVFPETEDVDCYLDLDCPTKIVIVEGLGEEDDDGEEAHR